MITRQFVTAGDAIFTIETPAEHYTYRVTRIAANDRYPESYFVKLLTGPDNTGSYTYMGRMNPETAVVETTAKSRKFSDSFPLRLLNRVLARVWADDHAAYIQHGYATHHCNHCGRCGRLLTTPEPEAIMAIQNAGNPIPGERFDWQNETKSFVAEESTLRGPRGEWYSGFGPRYLFQPIYPDAADAGFPMRSAKTGAVAWFAFTRADETRADETGTGEDREIAGWHFEPTPEAVRDNPALAGVTVVISDQGNP